MTRLLKTRFPTASRRLLAAILMLPILLPGHPALAEEQMEMDGMAVIGNSELPKALFIVPWKDPEAALAPDRPINTLLDEALQPVDPEVFRRKLRYFDTVHRKD